MTQFLSFQVLGQTLGQTVAVQPIAGVALGASNSSAISSDEADNPNLFADASGFDSFASLLAGEEAPSALLEATAIDVSLDVDPAVAESTELDIGLSDVNASQETAASASLILSAFLPEQVPALQTTSAVAVSSSPSGTVVPASAGTDQPANINLTLKPSQLPQPAFGLPDAASAGEPASPDDFLRSDTDGQRQLISRTADGASVLLRQPLSVQSDISQANQPIVTAQLAANSGRAPDVPVLQQAVPQTPLKAESGGLQNTLSSDALTNPSQNASQPSGAQHLAHLLSSGTLGGDGGPSASSTPSLPPSSLPLQGQAAVPAHAANLASGQAQTTGLQFSSTAFANDTLPHFTAQLSRSIAGGKDSFTVRLNPSELGRVDVRLITNEDGSVNARVQVERSETLDLFQRDVRALERSLQQSGLKLSSDGIDLSLKDNGTQEQGRGNGFSDDLAGNADQQTGSDSDASDDQQQNAGLTDQLLIDDINAAVPADIIQTLYARFVPGQLNIKV